MRFKSVILLLFSSILIHSCQQPESPEFKYLENVKVDLENMSSANLHAEAVLFNSNKKSILIKKADIDIIMEDKVVAVLDNDYNIKVKPQSEFRVPLDIKVELKDLDINPLGLAIGLMGAEGKEVRYLGKIKVKAYGLPFSVKVDFKDHLKIKI